MTDDIGPSGGSDYTPGEWKAKDTAEGEMVEVDTSSLMSFGATLLADTNASFTVSDKTAARILGLGVGGESGGPIGNDETLVETVTVASYARLAYEKALQMSADFVDGHLALANVAMTMAAKYGDADHLNATGVADAFDPPSGQKDTLARQRAELVRKAEEEADELAEEERERQILEQKLGGNPDETSGPPTSDTQGGEDMRPEDEQDKGSDSDPFTKPAEDDWTGTGAPDTPYVVELPSGVG
jgi:hypothetical protein